MYVLGSCPTVARIFSLMGRIALRGYAFFFLAVPQLVISRISF